MSFDKATLLYPRILGIFNAIFLGESIMTGVKKKCPKLDVIAETLACFMKDIETLASEESEPAVKPVVDEMTKKLKKILREINRDIKYELKAMPQNAQHVGYDAFESSDYLEQVVDVIKKYQTDLEVMPGFWNKLANLVNELIGTSVFTVDKTAFGLKEDEQKSDFQAKKEELKELKEQANQDKYTQILPW